MIDALSADERAFIVFVDESEDGLVSGRILNADGLKLAARLARKGLIFRNTRRDEGGRFVEFERNAEAARIIQGVTD